MFADKLSFQPLPAYIHKGYLQAVCQTQHHQREGVHPERQPTYPSYPLSCKGSWHIALFVLTTGFLVLHLERERLHSEFNTGFFQLHIFGLNGFTGFEFNAGLFQRYISDSNGFTGKWSIWNSDS